MGTPTPEDIVAALTYSPLRAWSGQTITFSIPRSAFRQYLVRLSAARRRLVGILWQRAAQA